MIKIVCSLHNDKKNRNSRMMSTKLHGQHKRKYVNYLKSKVSSLLRDVSCFFYFTWINITTKFLIFYLLLVN